MVNQSSFYEESKRKGLLKCRWPEVVIMGKHSYWMRGKFFGSKRCSSRLGGKRKEGGQVKSSAELNQQERIQRKKTTSLKAPFI